MDIQKARIPQRGIEMLLTTPFGNLKRVLPREPRNSHWQTLSLVERLWQKSSMVSTCHHPIRLILRPLMNQTPSILMFLMNLLLLLRARLITLQLLHHMKMNLISEMKQASFKERTFSTDSYDQPYPSPETAKSPETLTWSYSGNSEKELEYTMPYENLTSYETYSGSILDKLEENYLY